jgi:hypothetical protein
MASVSPNITFSVRWAWIRKATSTFLGIASGATENAAAVKQLLTGLRDRGLATDRKYLFIIDGGVVLCPC